MLEICGWILPTVPKKMVDNQPPSRGYYTKNLLTNFPANNFMGRTEPKDAHNDLITIQMLNHMAQILVFGLVAPRGQMVPLLLLPLGPSMDAKWCLDQR